MNGIIYLSSDEEDDKIVDHTDVFDDEKPNHTGQRKPVSSDVMVEEEDDDCVVLDGDPYKTKETISNTCVTDDDILVLGQKGEVKSYQNFHHYLQLVRKIISEVTLKCIVSKLFLRKLQLVRRIIRKLFLFYR